MIKNENVLLPMSLILTRTTWLTVLRNDTMISVSADCSPSVSGVTLLKSPSAPAMILTFVFSTDDTASTIILSTNIMKKRT